MEIKNVLSLKITDGSFIAEARRFTSYAAESMGFNEIDSGRVSIIVTELVSNLIKHTTAHSGEFYVRELVNGKQKGIEILAVDKGPGMLNVAECLRDGYSTAGSVGTGLGSIQRLSDDFDIYSLKDSGTVILSRIWLAKNHGITLKPYDISAFAMPLTGEVFNGDGWTSYQTPNKITIMLCDGLGHGEQAASASEQAIQEFMASKDYPLNELMNNIHSRLRTTRGAAISLAEIDSVRNIVSYCGIGNVTGLINYPDHVKNMISHNGIVGHEIRKIQVYEYPWNEDALLIMHSDGLTTRWNLDKYPGLFVKTLPIIVSTIFRDFNRGTDDATIVAVRRNIR